LTGGSLGAVRQLVAKSKSAQKMRIQLCLIMLNRWVNSPGLIGLAQKQLEYFLNI
jgi:hypothetical protein